MMNLSVLFRVFSIFKEAHDKGKWELTIKELEAAAAPYFGGETHSLCAEAILELYEQDVIRFSLTRRTYHLVLPISDLFDS